MIKSVSVIGSGLMGNGIAQVVATSGLKVKLIDVNEKALTKGIDTIRKNLGRVASKKIPAAADQKVWQDKIMANISTGTTLELPKETDLVIEAIVENLQAKIDLFKQLDQKAPQNAILASNTSSISITKIMKGVNSKQRQWAGLHFFNPVPMMKLVEIVNIENGTSEATYGKLVDFCKTLGKTSVKCKDTPGFIVNRLLVPYMMEAVALHERGDASLKDIDTSMKLGAGYPLGPFELADMVGLDTLKFIVDGWKDKNVFPDGFGGSALLNSMVKEGKLGRKSGQGFYDYRK